MLNTLLPNLKLTWHHSVPYMDLQITKHVQGDVATLSQQQGGRKCVQWFFCAI
jgi:hypothetical protein